MCGRWLHESCVEEVICDDNGEERLCTLCQSLLSYYVCTCPCHATAADFGISDVIIF